MKKNLILIFSIIFWNNSVLGNYEFKYKNVDSLGLELFRLFKEQKADSIIDRYFLDENESELFEELVLPKRKNVNINYQYDSIIYLMKNNLERETNIAISHNTNFEKLTIINLDTFSVYNKYFKSEYKEQLLCYKILCTDNTKKYSLMIGPLVRINNRWKIYLTEFKLRIEE